MALLNVKKHIVNSLGEEEELNIYTTISEATNNGLYKSLKIQTSDGVLTGYIGITEDLDTPKASSKRLVVDGVEYAERKYMGITNFYGWLKTNYPSNYTTITEINLSDTSDGTNFEQMFSFGSRLTTINNLDTRNGTNFRDMFFGCSSLTEQPSVDTSKSTSVQSMFNGCLKIVEFKNMNTSNVDMFVSLYNGCSSATIFPQLDTSNGTSFGSMYYGCSSATTFPQLDTSKGTFFENMYRNCYKAVKVSEIDFSRGKDERLYGINCSLMFYNCSSLRSITFNNLPIGTTEETLRNKCSIPSTVTEIIMNYRSE